MEIAIINKQELAIPIPATVSKESRDLIIAFQAPKVLALKKYEIGEVVDKAITAAFYHLGYNIPAQNEMIALQSRIVAELQGNWKTLSLEEVKIAIKRGSDGEYGENFGISPSAVNRWIKGFLASKEVEDAKEEYGKILKADFEKKYIKPAPSEYEVNENRKSIILKAFEAYKNKKSYEDHGSYVYDSLDRLGVMPFDKRDKKDFLLQSIESLKSKYLAKIEFELNRNKRLELKRKIDALNAEEVVFTPELKAEAKRLTLYAYFDSLILEEVNIEELLV